MRYPPVPDYSKSKINRAGNDIKKHKVGTPEYEAAVQVINEWRIAHAYPINTFVATLRKKVQATKDPIVAQRLKRLPTIINKLERYPEMELSRMQDIGGVRGILHSIADVQRLAAEYRDPSRFTHKLVRFDDYIAAPKDDGYRGVHLVFRYRNTLSRNNKAASYDGLLIELQLRTKLQHTWSTAVETMGTFKNQAFKSNSGNKDWLEFFALTSSSFAYLESTPPLARYEKLALMDTFKKMQKLDKKNRIIEQVRGYSLAANVIHTNNITGYYNLITLDTQNHSIKITSFAKDDLAKASYAYQAVEERAAKGELIESVLVSAGRLKSLRLAYPNYFLDIGSFLEKIDVIYGEIM